jgi:hypothetical protein
MTRTLGLYVATVCLLSSAVAAAVWFYPAATGPSSASTAAERQLPTLKFDTRPAEGTAADEALPVGVKIAFVNATARAGIDFRHFDGRTDMEYIMDQTGSGIGWIDYDQDGLLDLFIVQGSTFEGEPPKPEPKCKLFKNLGGGKFKDVTADVGLGHVVGCGQGVAVGDIDNDGYPDLFLTYYGKPNVLLHNVPDGKGGRRFEDITVKAGLGENPDSKKHPNYSTSAAFLDYNNDGRLDLFVCSYVQIDMVHYPICKHTNGQRGPCPPGQFKGTHCLLYRNNGNGTFTDVSHEAGIDEPNAKGLGVVALDLDDDGWIDIFVANDGVPNFLFRNLGNGRFQSMGPASGCAVNLAGTPQAYMGVEADDLNGDGRPDIFSTAFSRETNTFWRNEGGCQFLDITQMTGLGAPSWYDLAFGTCFLDVDRDGSLDIFVSNGHVDRHIELEGDPTLTFRQKARLFLNDGKGRFRDISPQAGAYFLEGHVGRGVAYADYDNDGNMDLALNNSGEPAVLLHNESVTPNHWIRLELRGTKSNRDAVGAKVTVYAGARKIVRHRKGGGSYLSAHDPRLLIGVGDAQKVDKVEIRWPSSSTVQVLGPLDVDRGYRIIEGQKNAEPRP